MTQNPQILLSLLKLGVATTKASDKEGLKLLSLSMQEWREVMTFAESQGVLAFAVDGLQALMDAHTGELVAVKEDPTEWHVWLLENIVQLTQYEMMNCHQKKVIAELSEMWATEGIRMLVFKGQANATLYSKPEHRAVGDIDCWLFGEAEKGDKIARAYGADVSFDWYRHSKIVYKSETIENHRVMSHTRGNKKRKEMEVELISMLNPAELSMVDGCGKALMPSLLFNACFLTYHGLHHFTTEGLRVKQILDWAMFLQKDQDKVDWPKYNDFCKRYKLDRFATIMNFIASEYLGVQNKKQDIMVDSTYAQRVLQSTLYNDNYLFNSGKSDWAVRCLLVKNLLTRDKWKYRDIAQQNVWKLLCQSAKGYLFDKD